MCQEKIHILINHELILWNNDSNLSYGLYDIACMVWIAEFILKKAYFLWKLVIVLEADDKA